jgi:sarcosine oxidase, subunit beta
MNSTAKYGGASKRIVVIGGGIIGCCTALHLLKSGAGQVTIVEAREPAAATTGAGAGFVSHWSAGMIPLGEEGLRLQQYGLDFYKELSELGEEIGYRPNGTLIMALTEKGRETFVRPVLESPYAPAEMQDLNAAQIGEKMQGLIDPTQVHSGAYNPRGIQLDTKMATGVLVKEIVRLGGVFRNGTKVTGIQDLGSQVKIETDKGEIEADGAVIAAGAWSNELLQDLGWHLPLLRVLATRVVTDGRGLPSTIPTVQCRELGLWLRETFGAVMWGTGGHYHSYHRLGDDWIEPGQPHKADLMQAMNDGDLARLQEVFPPLRGSKVASWAQGVPCYTPDRGLLIGHVPGTTNVVVAGGDNESGVSHGPGLGRLAAELMLGQAPFFDPTRFRLERFERGAYSTDAEVEAALPSWTGEQSKAPFASTRA